jgi:hypothetical protein
MKHHYSFIAGLAVIIGMVLPATTLAATITPPNDTVAISETTYHALKKATCYSANPPAGFIAARNGNFCDPIIVQYDNKTVMRVEAQGQLYVVSSAVIVPGKGVHGRLLKTYTQGIYRVKGKYYYVKDGYYAKLSRTRPDISVFNLVRGNNVEKTSGVQLITRAEFEMLFGKGGTPAEAAAAKKVQQAYKGYFVIIRDDKGKLYYVPNTVEDGTNPVRVNGAFHKTIKEVSNAMSAKELSKMFQE